MRWPRRHLPGEELSPAAAERITVAQPTVIDVRTARRRVRPWSASIPLNQLQARLGEIRRDRPVLLYCAGGYLSLM
jgi:rhodanese-related sulfurtransferase